MFRGYWADVGTVGSFYDANMMLTSPQTPFKFYDPRRPIYTHPRFLPGSRLRDCSFDNVNCRRGLPYRSGAGRGFRRRHPDARAGGLDIRRSVLLGADFYEADDEAPARGDDPRLGIGKDVVLDRVIVDKNARIGDGARLTNEAGVTEADGDGYYIRNGVIIVPKDGVVRPGTRI